uniref:Disease resistance protein Roq1 n=1 Tax=Nicotiana benthamiana TaxID=4100 RepID=ROQ1_NICBE|nr:RecName: Full=Disease resistance protein Roq1; AltName: Full=2' cyclic ADP-D-ribose synthase; Short=2'cADPR synthase Roq1; AltName: Full=NAD(+) hydrolase RPV1; AltName: Full=Recognition of XopQ 1 protein [Nicotiana benthamiana]7JLV_A Chain A, Disease resistance protein Roq1 [Nicotiana benthamiana]7JLV_B Chain B, Disease resistance protein Roq1 [Nicotiana benthamiana]7JLV_D Chain D, Disease resistance protein Roq1 [Nicotiana benthamiana]7JLV_G Chain G, Disease resistance protein Roq1 [Nicotia
MLTSSSHHGRSYDVFLSFRGEDTRKTFVGHLFNALIEKGIHTFMDDKELKRGKSISSELMKAIGESRFAVVVFSKNYASSTWCLEELVKILEIHEKFELIVVPVFYDVDPSTVRKQNGEYAVCFTKFEANLVDDRDKVLRWREALTKVANISGHDLRNTYNGDESKCIQQILKDIFDKFCFSISITNRDLVGIESQIKKLSSLLRMDLKGVRLVGIWGMGGVGKTTAARALFNRYYQNFESACFLEDVKEYLQHHTLLYLQKTLLSKLLKVEFVDCTDTEEMCVILKRRLCSKKVLVVLDDVNHNDQLDKLVGAEDWFGSGSRIVITTRDMKLLKNHDVHETYEIKVLEKDEAIELFNLHAFKRSSPEKEFKELLNLVVDYTGGLPLALKVLGSLLYKEDLDVWISTIDRLKDNPEGEIMATLKISFDGLRDYEKSIFLDIACFFRGYNQRDMTALFHASGFHPVLGVKTLVEKSLIFILEDKIQMHDLMQEMGRQIAVQESPMRRIYRPEDVKDACIGDMRKEAIEGLLLTEPEQFEEGELEYMYSAEALKKTRRLRILVKEYYNRGFDEPVAYLPNSLLWLEWRNYSSNSFPSNFEPSKLVYLTMKGSSIIELWNGAKRLAFLTTLDLSYCHKLIQTPDFRMITNLERLILSSCDALVEVHPSVGFLKNLILLNMDHCISLERLPAIIQSECLEVLDLNYCFNLKMFPEVERNMTHLKKLDLTSTGIRELPASIEHLSSLENLQMHSCNQLVSLPSSIWRFRNLKISECEKLGSLPEIHGNSNCTRELILKLVSIKELPTSIGNLTSLNFLEICNCKTISSLSSSIWGLTSLTTLKLLDCRKLKNLPGIPNAINHLSGHGLQLLLTLEQPTIYERLDLLRIIDMSWCSCISSLPHNIWMLKFLRILCISYCSRLEYLPENLGHLEHLEELLADGTGILRLPSSVARLNKLEVLSFRKKFAIGPKVQYSSSMLNLPDDVFGSLGSLGSVVKLNLSGNGFCNLPETMNQLFCLEYLDITFCQRLEALPELPPSIKELYVDEHLALRIMEDLVIKCKELNLIAVTKIEYQNFYRWLDSIWSDVSELLENSQKQQLDDMLQLIPFSYLSTAKREEVLKIVIHGTRIPEWFRWQDRSATTMSVNLPEYWYTENFLGFAICCSCCFYHSARSYDVEFEGSMHHYNYDSSYWKEYEEPSYDFYERDSIEITAKLTPRHKGMRTEELKKVCSFSMNVLRRATAVPNMCFAFFPFNSLCHISNLQANNPNDYGIFETCLSPGDIRHRGKQWGFNLVYKDETGGSVTHEMLINR